MTSIGGQASLKCFVESFPKAITYWTKKSNHPEYFDRLIEKRLVSAYTSINYKKYAMLLKKFNANT